MNLRNLALATLGASLGATNISCTTEPASARAPATAMLVGATAAGTRILIKSVDQGPTLWSETSALGSRVWITPGHHKVHVICEVDGSMVDKEVTMYVQAGQVYDLVGSPNRGPEKCDVAVSSRSS